MDFKLSEMQQDIAKLAKDFAEKELAPTVKERDEKEVFDRAILDKMGTLGLLGIPWEEENGGVGADFLSLAVACEEVAKVDPSIALSFEVHTMLCSWPIWKFGTAEQKAKYLKPLAEGTLSIVCTATGFLPPMVTLPIFTSRFNCRIKFPFLFLLTMHRSQAG